jgi:hypothetical protein
MRAASPKKSARRHDHQGAAAARHEHARAA